MSLDVSPGEMFFAKVKDGFINTLSVSKKSLNFCSANASDNDFILLLILHLFSDIFCRNISYYNFY